MEKLQKFMQYGYLVIAVVLIGEGTYKIIEGETGRGIIGLVFAILAIFMYFFKKRFRDRTRFNNK